MTYDLYMCTLVGMAVHIYKFLPLLANLEPLDPSSELVLSRLKIDRLLDVLGTGFMSSLEVEMLVGWFANRIDAGRIPFAAPIDINISIALVLAMPYLWVLRTDLGKKIPTVKKKGGV